VLDIFGKKQAHQKVKWQTFQKSAQLIMSLEFKNSGLHMIDKVESSLPQIGIFVRFVHISYTLQIKHPFISWVASMTLYCGCFQVGSHPLRKPPDNNLRTGYTLG